MAPIPEPAMCGAAAELVVPATEAVPVELPEADADEAVDPDTNVRDEGQDRFSGAFYLLAY